VWVFDESLTHWTLLVLSTTHWGWIHTGNEPLKEPDTHSSIHAHKWTSQTHTHNHRERHKQTDTSKQSSRRGRNPIILTGCVATETFQTNLLNSHVVQSSKPAEAQQFPQIRTDALVFWVTNYTKVN